MSVASSLNELPFVQLMGIEIREAAEGEATARLALDGDHHSAPGVAHGGVPYALADTAGGAAVIRSTSDRRRPLTCGSTITRP